MVGLIGAMAVEVEALLSQLEGRQDRKIGMDVFSSGKLFGQEAVLAVCGPGKVNAALCAQSMIAAYHPDWVLNLGVAGAGDASPWRMSRRSSSCWVRFTACTWASSVDRERRR